MDFNSLYHFVIVMEELSFTKAAKRLYLSQQAVSSQIKKLRSVRRFLPESRLCCQQRQERAFTIRRLRYSGCIRNFRTS